MTDPKTQEIGERLAEAREAGAKAVKRTKLKDITDGIEKGKATIEAVDAMTGNNIPFARSAEQIAEISIEGIGLFAKVRRMFGKKKIL